MMNRHEPMVIAKRSAMRSPIVRPRSSSSSTFLATWRRFMKRLTTSRSSAVNRSISLARNFFAVSILKLVIGRPHKKGRVSFLGGAATQHKNPPRPPTRHDGSREQAKPAKYRRVGPCSHDLGIAGKERHKQHQRGSENAVDDRRIEE